MVCGVVCSKPLGQNHAAKAVMTTQTPEPETAVAVAVSSVAAYPYSFVGYPKRMLAMVPRATVCPRFDSAPCIRWHKPHPHPCRIGKLKSYQRHDKVPDSELFAQAAAFRSFEIPNPTS
jgi:hypothetical protein